VWLSLVINNSEAAKPSRINTKVTTAAVGRSKAMLMEDEVKVLDEVCVALPLAETT